MKKMMKFPGMVIISALLLGITAASPVAFSPQEVSGSNLPPIESPLPLPSDEEGGGAMGLPSQPLEWCIVDTPGSAPNLTRDILASSEISKLAVGSDGTTMYAVVNQPADAALPLGGRLYYSNSGGRIWSAMVTENLLNAGAVLPVWDVAVAPDDPNFVAVIASDATGLYPAQVWVSCYGGTTWQSTFIENFLLAGDYISCVDISPDYGGKRDIAVGTRDGTGVGACKMWTLQVPGFGNWSDQSNPATGDPNNTWADGDVLAATFSPSCASDATIALVCSASSAAAPAYDGCFVITGVRDFDQNTTHWGTPVWVSDPATQFVFSANCSSVVSACLRLPFDFSGLAASLRRFYISIDDGGGVDMGGGIITESGIFRVDDTTVYELMDTTNAGHDGKRISSIAYYGTYASGKLLVGEVRGDPCWATVPTWFTDSPTTCPIPCWYPAKKPTTGAAGIPDCGAATGWGNAQVAWSADGATAYAATGSNEPGRYAVATGAFVTNTWPDGLLNVRARDESAFGLTRNNGETWNQLAMIDTEIDKLTDVAPSADSSTLYLASINNGTEGWLGCDGFDSVWRTTSNPAVCSPLPALAVGNVWERVLCRSSNTTCDIIQSNYCILRLAPDKEDGQIVFWAAGGAGTSTNTRAVAWSPDYGDYWANINPRLTVQDMAAESSTTLYILQADGLVQMMPYTGTAWSSAIPNSNTSLGSAFSIAALAQGHVLVGASASSGYPAAYSADAATSFTAIPEQVALNPSDVHVAFDADFDANGIIYAGTENSVDPGAIYRNTVPGYTQWTDLEPLALGYHGLAISAPGRLYAANPLFVERTLDPETGLPGERREWDVLMSGLPGFPVRFTLQPNSLKTSGGLIPGTVTRLWAIDDNSYLSPETDCGRLWAYEDCVAQTGPALTTPDTILVNCDPVSGRAAQISLSWERLCLERFYELQIADDVDFTQGIWRHLWYEAPIIDSPTFVVPAGGMSGTSVDAPGWVETLPDTVFDILGVSPDMDVIGLEPTIPVPPLSPECGRTYYWRIRTTGSVDDDLIRSPWSETRSFTVKGGSAPPLIAPANGAIGCPVSPASFSWAAFMGSTSYMFQLASDAAMTDIIAEDTVGATAYEYSGTLDYGASYFWRVMAIAPAPSNWSATFNFTTTQDGTIPQLLSPDDGAIGCPVSQVLFSWSPSEGATSYMFQLATDTSMTNIIVEHTVAPTAYEYSGTLDYSTTYFWRVMAAEPAPSAWSTTCNFTTAQAGAVPVAIDVPYTIVPHCVAPCSDFRATVEIGEATDLNGVQYDVCFDPSILRLDDITAGQIGGTEIPVQFNEISPGTYTVLHSMGLGTVTGSGYLSELHFHVIGSWGQSSNVHLANGILSGMADEIPATWTGYVVYVFVVPGDANCDNKINVLDMTRVARIILGLDPATPCPECYPPPAPPPASP